MANFEIKLTLSKVPNSKFITLGDGKKYIALPLEGDSMYQGEKGIYMTLSAIERKEPKDGQTHFIKPYVPYERFKDMTKEEKQEIPIVGNVVLREQKHEGMQAEAVTAVEEDLPF